MNMKRTGGFTLIEVLVALIVTVAALGVIAQGLTTGARASGISQYATRGAILGQRVMTGIETGEISPGTSQSTPFDDEPEFAYQTDSAPDPEEVGLNIVTVTVRWKEREEERTFVLTRLLRDKTASTTATTGTNP